MLGQEVGVEAEIISAEKNARAPVAKSCPPKRLYMFNVQRSGDAKAGARRGTGGHERWRGQGVAAAARPLRRISACNRTKQFYIRSIRSGAQFVCLSAAT